MRRPCSRALMGSGLPALLLLGLNICHLRHALSLGHARLCPTVLLPAGPDCSAYGGIVHPTCRQHRICTVAIHRQHKPRAATDLANRTSRFIPDRAARTDAPPFTMCVFSIPPSSPNLRSGALARRCSTHRPRYATRSHSPAKRVTLWPESNPSAMQGPVVWQTRRPLCGSGL